MAEDKSFLQSIKLEISKNFRLLPYERIIFHKILGILKTSAGLSILTKELNKGPQIRESAISALVKFNDASVIPLLLPFLKKNITKNEQILILNHIERHGTVEHVPALIELIESIKNDTGSIDLARWAFRALASAGRDSEAVQDYCLAVINTKESLPETVCYSIPALARLRSLSIYENMLRREDDAFACAVFNSLHILSKDIVESAPAAETEEERLFTYSSENEDRIVLDIRVLLGKTAPKFDSFSAKTKVAYINAMIACNHREFLIYVMKSLTSTNMELIRLMLYCLHTNINMLRDPDKLFRNLIALSAETEWENSIVIDIFVKYFTVPRNTRQFHMLRDKMFSYIVVTLETYFESYRKDFMITEVLEKGLPENFQKVRKFILKKFNPDLKKRIVSFLQSEEPDYISHLMGEVAKWTQHITDDEKIDLQMLIDILYDSEKKSREISASRLENINFEKKYLKNRIIRLCGIIEKLNIHDAASPLVNIYNYLKKYPEQELNDASIHTLSVLNYSYMLGEIEVMLTTGSETDQKKALDLISLFTEQRSLNILLEFIQARTAEETPVMQSAVAILLERDIGGNATAKELFKKLIETNKKPEIRSVAILGLGRCGFSADLEYLNELFFNLGRDDPKDSVIRAISHLYTDTENINKRLLIKNLQEYLKDPGIKVRIYSCLILAKLGNKDALRSIRDMLVIRNKSIQRDMLTILGDLQSVEFSFFLLSLLKEEYGISGDIIPVLEYLPEEELKEIDAFAVNIFRKFEAPEIEGVDSNAASEIITVKGLRDEEVTLLSLDIFDYSQITGFGSIGVMVNLNLKIRSLIPNALQDFGGTVTRLSLNRITAMFADPAKAAGAALKIIANFHEFNRTRILEKNTAVSAQIVTGAARVINDELIIFPEYEIIKSNDMLLMNRIILNGKAAEKLAASFEIKPIPELAISGTGQFREFFEMSRPVNFMETADGIISAIIGDMNKKIQMQKQIEAELKKLKREGRSQSSIAIAGELDRIGNRLRDLLDELERYVQRRSTDRELIRNTRKMLNNVYEMYRVEVAKIIIER